MSPTLRGAGAAETEEGALQTPPPLAARALTHARSARWPWSPFPSKPLPPRSPGGGASWNAAAFPAAGHPDPGGGPGSGACWERSGVKLRIEGCSRARPFFKNGAERARVFERLGDLHWKFVFGFRAEVGLCKFLSRNCGESGS